MNDVKTMSSKSIGTYLMQWHLEQRNQKYFIQMPLETGHNVLLITVEYVGATSLPIIAGKPMYYYISTSLFSFDKSCTFLLHLAIKWN